MVQWWELTDEEKLLDAISSWMSKKNFNFSETKEFEISKKPK